MEPWSHAQIVRVAERLSGDARVIGLVACPGERPRTVEWAAALAAAIGRRRSRTILVNLDDESEGLDEWLAERGGAGFSQAIRGEVPLARIAASQPAWAFVFLAAGEDPTAPNHLLRSPVCGRFLKQVTAKRGTVLIYLGLQEADPELWRATFDGMIVLGNPADHAVETIGVPVLGRIGTVELEMKPEAVREAVPEAVPEAVQRAQVLPARTRDEVERVRTPAAKWRFGLPSNSRGHRRKARRGRSQSHRSRPAATAAVRPVWVVGSVVAAVVSIALLWLAWSRVASRARELPDAVAAAPAAAPGAAREDSLATSAGAPPPPADRKLTSGELTSPELPYSVLIASYGSWQDAERRVHELEARDETVYFVAPTPVRGSLYYRLFGGAREDATGTVHLMERLVRSGQKDRVSSWDMRPVRFAFDLGERRTAAAARAARDSLRARGVPAYVLPIARGRERRFHLYSGAFESPGASIALAAILRQTVGRKELVERKGEAR